MAEAPTQDCVIVTGSSGLIGSAVVKRLSEEGYRVFGWDRDEPAGPLPPHFEFQKVDLTSEESVNEAAAQVSDASGNRVASVVHLAAYYDFSGEPSEMYEKVTVRGTERVLQALQRQSVNLQQFLFSSTLLVYAPTQPGESIAEDWPVEPKWAYPESKVKTEQLLREEHEYAPLVLMRVAGVYTDECNSIPLAQQMRRIYEKQLTSHVFPGDTSHGQSFVHLKDLVRAIARAVEHRRALPAETVLLIGEPETYSYDTLQKTYGKLMHDEDDWYTQEIPKTLAKTGAWVQGKIPGMEEPFIKPWMIDLADDHYEVDITRAKSLIEWEPRHRLIDTLPAMVEALKRDPVAWYRAHKLDPPDDLQKES